MQLSGTWTANVDACAAVLARESAASNPECVPGESGSRSIAKTPAATGSSHVTGTGVTGRHVKALKDFSKIGTEALGGHEPFPVMSRII